MKFGISAYFCSQECFKANWSTHKMLHQLIEQKQAEAAAQKPNAPPKADERFAGYKFTGKLRPGLVSAYRPVPPHIKKPDYANSITGESLAEKQMKQNNNITVHTPEQIERLRKSCKIAAELLAIGAAAVKVGITTDEIDRIVHEACIARNAYPSPLGYGMFPKSLCTSVNEVVCHGIPDSRPLEDGDIVNLDISVYFEGMHSDCNATYPVGKVDEQSLKLIDTARRSLDEAIVICKPGTMYREVGDVISKVVHAQGFSVVRTYCGHGVGELFHAPPNVPHYAKNKVPGAMKPGHVFTIEPMINMGTWRDKLWPDNWTDVTEDGMRSAQFEHTLLITETGCEVLTKL